MIRLTCMFFISPVADLIDIWLQKQNVLLKPVNISDYTDKVTGNKYQKVRQDFIRYQQEPFPFIKVSTPVNSHFLSWLHENDKLRVHICLILVWTFLHFNRYHIKFFTWHLSMQSTWTTHFNSTNENACSTMDCYWGSGAPTPSPYFKCQVTPPLLAENNKAYG